MFLCVLCFLVFLVLFVSCFVVVLAAVTICYSQCIDSLADC